MGFFGLFSNHIDKQSTLLIRLTARQAKQAPFDLTVPMLDKALDTLAQIPVLHYITDLSDVRIRPRRRDHKTLVDACAHSLFILFMRGPIFHSSYFFLTFCTRATASFRYCLLQSNSLCTIVTCGYLFIGRHCLFIFSTTLFDFMLSHHDSGRSLSIVAFY